MDETRVAWMSAREVAAAIRAGELTSRAHLEAMLARIDRLDEPLNLVITRDDQGARRSADEADREAARGRWRGPLHGVAMTIKDSFQTAGLRTTCGAPELADFVPREDAVAVARLRAAGAVIAGKTNLPLYAADLQSYNQLFGQSNNPWDTGRTAGGSSGGAAGALAAGLRTDLETLGLADEVELLDPVPCPVARVADHFRYELLLQADGPGPLQRLLAAVRSRGGLGPGHRVAVDVDPIAVL